MITRPTVRTHDGQNFWTVPAGIDSRVAVRAITDAIASSDDERTAHLLAARDMARGTVIAQAIADALVAAGVQVETVESTATRARELRLVVRWQQDGKALSWQRVEACEALDLMALDPSEEIAREAVSAIAAAQVGT